MHQWKFTLLVLSTALTIRAAEFTPNGVIEGKSGRIAIDQQNGFAFQDNGGTISTFLSAFDPEEKWFSTSNLKEAKRTVDFDRKSVTVTGIYPATGKSPPIPVEYSLTLLPDGHTARVSIDFQADAVQKGFRLYLAFQFGYRDFIKDRHVLIDGKEINCSFDRTQEKRMGFYGGRAQGCVFNMPEDNSLLKFKLINIDQMDLAQSWNASAKMHDSFDMSFAFPKDGKLVFDLDLD